MFALNILAFIFIGLQFAAFSMACMQRITGVDTAPLPAPSGPDRDHRLRFALSCCPSNACPQVATPPFRFSSAAAYAAGPTIGEPS